MTARRAGMTVLVSLLLVGSGCIARTTHSKEDRRVLDRFRTDPVGAFRAPGTELQSTREVLGGVKHQADGRFGTSSELSQTLTMAGDAGDTVASYLKAAGEAGWRLVKVNCSRQAMSVQAVFTTLPAGLSRIIPVNEPRGGFTRSAEVLTVTALPETHALQVRFVVDIQPDDPAPSSAGLPRRDVHCLKSFDPGDPRRQPSSLVPARTAAQLCALASTAPLRDRVLRTPSPSEPLGFSPRCEFGLVDGSSVILSDAAQRPRASFEDRQYSPRYADAGFFLLADDSVGDPEGLGGAWVDTPGGPIEVHMLLVADEAVLSFGRAVQKAASAPKNAPPTVASTTTTSRTPVTTTPPGTRGRCRESLVPDPNCSVGPFVTGRP